MTDQQANQGSLLGNGSEFSGKLTFMGTVRIEGVFEGKIFSNDTLVVAAGGRVHGEIRVGTLIVTGGLVEATVEARDCVELYPPGRLVGHIETPSFQIEKGAVFDGKCTMPETKPLLEPEMSSGDEDPVLSD